MHKSELARDLLWCQVPLAIGRDRYPKEALLRRRRPSGIADDQPRRGGGENGAAAAVHALT